MLPSLNSSYSRGMMLGKHRKGVSLYPVNPSSGESGGGGGSEIVGDYIAISPVGSQITVFGVEEDAVSNNDPLPFPMSQLTSISSNEASPTPVSTITFNPTKSFPLLLTIDIATGGTSISNIINIPEGVTSLVVSDNPAPLFTLPNSLTSLSWAFGDITLPASLPTSLVTANFTGATVNTTSLLGWPAGLKYLSFQGCVAVTGGVPALIAGLETFYAANISIGFGASDLPVSIVTVDISGNNCHGLSFDFSAHVNLTNLTISYCSLDQSEVDQVLSALVTAGGLNGVLDISNNTAPSSTDDIDILISRGWTVTYDAP